MKRALIVVDYTVDFVADEGRLTCGAPGQGLEERIVQLTGEFLQQEQYVVMAVDFHTSDDPYHPESRLFPEHNIAGSAGRQLYGQLEDVVQRCRDSAQLYEMAKTRYSAFAGTDLDLRLRARGIQELHLAGVCTDICVLHTAVDAYNLGYQLVVHADAVQSFDADGHRWALGHFRNVLGAQVVEGGTVIASSQS